jgi:hypothetical protein
MSYDSSDYGNVCDWQLSSYHTLHDRFMTANY